MLIHWRRLANWLFIHRIPLLPKFIYYIQYLLFNSSVPAKPIKFKWTIDEIIQHEQILYPENQRYSKDKLEQIFNDYKNFL